MQQSRDENMLEQASSAACHRIEEFAGHAKRAVQLEKHESWDTYALPGGVLRRFGPELQTCRDSRPATLEKLTGELSASAQASKGCSAHT